METIILATDRGIVRAERGDNDWRQGDRSLVECTATSIIAREGVILAGTTEGVFRSNDGGQSWQPVSTDLTIRHVRWLAYHPEISDREFAGTEPAGVFVSHDGATSWRGCPEIEELRDRFGWFLPYSPEAGCVRGFAFHGDRAYAAVEVGGVLRSDDAGETWRLAGGSTGEPVFDIPPVPRVMADVHSVAGHHSSPELVFGATAEGLYLSVDGGDTWRATHAGSYCRALWVDPRNPDHIVLGPADSVAHKNGRIEETHNAGRTWVLASEGLDLPWPDRMVERFIQIEEELFAVTNDGRLYMTALGEIRWQRVLPGIEGIRALTSPAKT